MEKYFLDDVRSNKEINFLDLKQRNMIVFYYAAKFEEFVRFYPHYNGVEVEGLKCIKFKSNLRPKIKVYDEDNKTIFVHCKSGSDKKSGSRYRGKLYMIPTDKGKQNVGRHAAKCKSAGLKCFKCEKQGHHFTECKSNVPTYYNCGEAGHISTLCQKSWKESTVVQAHGIVFSLNGVDVSRSDNLI
ncbi:uncharacterized protein LOC127130066 [Lathyrus oleraceus]|uniref:uncharacterized protein LOC127130066 n=1 Tax=Pisum sativum TaxID=3888 RepID=UPI0021CE0573|nr:uncharacterized protein LOC127130066 [Pisum sativum]